MKKYSATIKHIFKMLIFYLSLIPLSYLISKYVINFAYTETESMAPTIQVGDKMSDRYLCNKLAYINKKPERGDIIIFKGDEEDVLYCKRIIALPGETISFENDCVYINDVKLDESAYIPEDFKTCCDKSFTVPDNCYFVLGDNREFSKDSRFFEQPYIPFSQIVSKVVLIIPTHKL